MKNILVLTYWSYKDALIQTYTLPYVRIIRKNINNKSKIYLFTLEQRHLKMSASEWKNEKKKLSSEGIYLLRFSYSHFGISTIFRFLFLFLRLFFLCVFKNIHKIHAWCTPAGAIGYILSKFTGISLIIDSYEPHAEAMVENGNWGKNDFAFKLLFYLEKKQSHHANVLIAATSGMKDYAKLKYHISPKFFFVKPACINIIDFIKDRDNNEDIKACLKIENEIVCVYAGKVGGIYLESEIFDFFKVAYDYWKGNFKVLMLTSNLPNEIYKYCEKSGLPVKNIFVKFVLHKDVSKYMSLADFAINPVKTVPSKRLCTSIKDGEYWAMGLPVVITPNISDDSEIIATNNIGSVLKSLNTEGYFDSVKEIDDLLKNNNKVNLQNKIKQIALQYRSYKIAESIYSQIYNKE
jgi:hypothetical protein